jgi:hypothetical protein
MGANSSQYFYIPAGGLTYSMFGQSKFYEEEKKNHSWECHYCDAKYTTDYTCEVLFEANAEIHLLYEKSKHTINKLFTEGVKLVKKDARLRMERTNENEDSGDELEQTYQEEFHPGYEELMTTTGSTTIKKGKNMVRGIRTNNPAFKQWWKDILEDGGEYTTEPIPEEWIRVCIKCLDNSEEYHHTIGDCKFYF